MAEQPQTLQRSPQNEAYEKEFRHKNLWYSFTSAMYGVVGGAALFGMAQNIGGMLLHAAAGEATLLSNPLTLLVAAGMGLVGVVATYFSQRELTEQRVIQDEHLACMNARQLGHAKTPEADVQPAQGLQLAQAQEYPQNCRRDGKPWEGIVKCEQPGPRQRR
jgi:hypothetical protein